jgi:hypothetical protein
MWPLGAACGNGGRAGVHERCLSSPSHLQVKSLIQAKGERNGLKGFLNVTEPSLRAPPPGKTVYTVTRM